MKPAHLIPTAALGAALLVAGCGGGDAPPVAASKPAAREAAAPPADVPAGRIAFRRYLDSAQAHGAVFTVNTDGTREQQVTRPPDRVVDDQPDWSPDGKRIAFERCASEKPCSVWTVSADGAQLSKVPVHCTRRPICDASGPAWLPDGRLIVGVAQGRERRHGE